MSSEWELTEAMREMAKVNAAGIMQRQQQAEQDKVSRDQGTKIHFLVNALSFAVKVNDGKKDRTAEHVMEDADKFVAWLERKYSGARRATND